MFSSQEQLKTIVAGQGGVVVGGGGGRTDCIIGDSRIEDPRLVSDKSVSSEPFRALPFTF